MDDMQMLRTLRSDVPPPAGDRMEAGRRRLEEAIGGGRARRRPGGRKLALIGAPIAVAAVIVATSLFGAQTPDSDHQRVEYGSVVEPRDDQWIYRKVVEKSAPLNFADNLNPVTQGPGLSPDETIVPRETWEQYGTGEERHKVMGHVMPLPLFGQPSSPPKRQRQLAAELPEDTSELLLALRAVIPIDDELQNSKEQADYMRTVQALSTIDFIPQRVRDSLFRTLKEIPGTQVGDRPVTDGLGRPALAVSYPGPKLMEIANLRKEMLFDPETFEYRGERSVYVAGGKIDGKPIAEDRVVSTRTLAKTEIVDSAPPAPTMEPRESETGSHGGPGAG